MIHTTNARVLLLLALTTQALLRPSPLSGFNVMAWKANMPHTRQKSSLDYASEQMQLENIKTQGVLLQNRGPNDRWSDENFQACTELWDLNNEEQQKMRELQLKLKDVTHWKNDPFEVVRFLKEFGGNRDVAETKFRKMVDWRIKNNVDTILEQYSPPRLFNYFPVAILKGVDRDGDPIHVERTGASDMPGLLEKYGEDEMIKHAIWIREQDSNGVWQRDYERTQGRHVKKFTAIFDMEGFNRKHFSPSLMPVGKKVSRFVQDNYPGYTKKIIIIRAPPVFRIAWGLFKPFVDKEMKDKIVISGNNYEATLKEHIGDIEVLPPVIHPKGKGAAVEGFDPVWEGGTIPKVDKEVPVLPKVEVTNSRANYDSHIVPLGVLSPA